MGRSPPGRTALLYDGACGPCGAFARAVQALDSDGLIELVPLQAAETRQRFESAIGKGYWNSFHLVDGEGGAVRSGADALERLAQLLPAVRPFAPWVFGTPGIRRLPAVAYAAASALRSCTLAPARG